MDYRVIFIESLSICALFLIALLLFHYNYSQGKLARSLITVYSLTIVTCILDIVWILLNGNPESISLHYPMMALYLSTFGYIGYFWLNYCIDSAPFVKLKQKWVKAVLLIPAVILTVVMFISISTGIAFFVNDEGFYVRGPLYLIQTTILFYYLGASVLCLFARKNTYYATKKHKYIVLASAFIPMVVLGTVQLILPPGALTTLQYALFFTLMLVFVNSQNGKITRDSLTKLANRYSLDNNLDARISRAQRDSAFCFSVILADLDDFKRINDTYGHMEGDLLLKRMAALISKSAEERGAYAARMSGDEFVMIIDTDVPEDISALCASVDREISEDSLCREYSSTISFGVAKYAPNDNITSILDRADNALYAEKEKKHAARGN